MRGNRTLFWTWRSLSVVTRGVVATTLLILSAIVVPGRFNFHNMWSPIPPFQEHGWPVVFLDRISPDYRSGTSIPEYRDYLASQQLGARLRRATFAVNYGVDDALHGSGPPWADRPNWSFSDTIWVSWLGLLIDLLCVFCIVITFAVACEWWQRRRWRFSLKSLFIGVFTGVAIVACTVGDYQSRRIAIADLRARSLDIDVRCNAPVWLKMLVGENRLSAFDHVEGISSWHLEEGELADSVRCERAVKSVVDNATHLRSVKNLHLDYMPVDDEDLKVLTSCAEIEKLSLRKTRVTDVGLKYLQDLRNLRDLSLGDTQIRGDGLRFLNALPRLHELALQNTLVTDDALCHVRSLTRLKTLNLNGTGITDAGMVNLVELKRLQHLYLENTKISDEGLAPIKMLGELRKLGLRNANVTDGGIESLRQVLTKCEFEYEGKWLEL